MHDVIVRYFVTLCMYVCVCMYKTHKSVNTESQYNYVMGQGLQLVVVPEYHIVGNFDGH